MTKISISNYVVEKDIRGTLYLSHESFGSSHLYLHTHTALGKPDRYSYAVESHLIRVRFTKMGQWLDENIKAVRDDINQFTRAGTLRKRKR